MRKKKLGQNSKIEIDNSNNNHTTTGSLSSSLHDAEELLLRQYNYLGGTAYEVLSKLAYMATSGGHFSHPSGMGGYRIYSG